MPFDVSRKVTFFVFLCDSSISESYFPGFLPSSPSASYPLRSWWAPGGAAAWWRRTPAPRCPPSAAPPSPRLRSASLHPRPTPRHHTRTRSRPLRPPEPRQDERCRPALRSSSPAPTPGRHRPGRTGRRASWHPPAARLLPKCSLGWAKMWRG